MTAAWLYDLVMVPLGWIGLRDARRRLGSRQPPGVVLELGTGTGLLLAQSEASAPPAVAIDLDLAALRRAKARAAVTALVCADVHQLPFRDAAFDGVVESLVFCSVADPARALAEVRRVLKPGGRFHLLEHVRAPGRVLGRILDLLTPAWRTVAGGCHLNRQPRPLLAAAGFEVLHLQTNGRGLIEHVEAAAFPHSAEKSAQQGP